MATLMTTADLAIDYAPTSSGFDYRVSFDGLWVASATTFHAADLVADEVRYRAFLAIPDEPPPDDAPGSDDENGTPHEALDVCPSCGDQLTWAGPGLCSACTEASKTLPFLLALS